jgi:hypothetical protein
MAESVRGRGCASSGFRSARETTLGPANGVGPGLRVPYERIGARTGNISELTANIVGSHLPSVLTSFKH